MKVLLLNQYFYPDLSAVAQMATDLAEDLAAAGMEVTALASQGSYLGGVGLAAEEHHLGVRIVRVPSTSFGKASLARRMSDYATYYLSAALRAARERRPDVVVAMSTPPLVASIGAALKVARGTPFAYWVQDLYPDLAVEFGVLGRRSVSTLAFDAVSKGVLRAADVAVVLGEAMAARVARKGMPAQRIRVIPNWADGSVVHPVPHERNAFRREQGLEGKRVVLYSGNMGRGHDMQTVLRAAEAFVDTPDVLFLFIGEGGKRGEVEAKARQLPNIRLLGYQPRERLSESLSAGDVHVVTQDANMSGLIEPSKLYGVLAAGRPTLYIGPRDTEVARTVLDERVGEVVANGDVAGATASLRRLLLQSNELGARARHAADARYDRHHRTRQFVTLFEELARTRSA